MNLGALALAVISIVSGAVTYVQGLIWNSPASTETLTINQCTDPESENQNKTLFITCGGFLE